MVPFLVVAIATGALALFVAAWVQSSFSRYNQTQLNDGLSGAEVATRILRKARVRGIEVSSQGGILSDYYDPARRLLVLSHGNYFGRTLATAGIAAHLAGLAIQDAQAYGPLRLRMAAVRMTNVATSLILWLPLIAIAIGVLPATIGVPIIASGWGAVMLFNLVTLPVEFDATRRANDVLTDADISSPEEREAGRSYDRGWLDQC